MHADILICIEVKNLYFSFELDRAVIKNLSKMHADLYGRLELENLT